MGDIICAICGEPWDAYGARHGDDMRPSEYHQLIHGKGCPCCDGNAPEGIDTEAVKLRYIDSLARALPEEALVILEACLGRGEGVREGMDKVYFSETDPEKVLSEMDPHHQAEFRIYSLGDTLGKLIWIGNVLEDIIHQADNPQFVQEHARDLKRAIHITMLEVAK